MLDTRLAYVCMSKNNLYNNNGFTPSQVMFGRNPSLPSVLVDKPPALSSLSQSDMIAKHISLIYSTRGKYVKAENSDRVRRALRHNVRYSQCDIKSGDWVYFRRQNMPNWRGPGRVIGVDGKVIFVRHGSLCYRVHQRDVIYAENNDLNDLTAADVAERGQTTVENGRIVHTLHDDEDIDVVQTPVGTEDRLETRVEGTLAVHERNLVQKTDDQQILFVDQPGLTEIEPTGTSVSGNDENRIVSEYTGRSGPEPPIVKSKIGFRSSDERTGDKIFEARILSGAGKANGRQKNWYNIEYTAPERLAGCKGAVDYQKNFRDWEIVESTEALVTCSEEVHQDAKEAEMQSWSNHGVYEIVNDEGQKTMGSRWILTMERDDSNNNSVPKARLVVKGITESLDRIDKESPVVSREVIKVFLSVASISGWTTKSIDIKTAFLQGKPLEREIFIPSPTGNVKGKLWKLLKPVYGLQDAPKQWYLKVKTELIKAGLTVCPFEPALFIWSNDGNCAGLICLHVDDFLWVGTPDFQTLIINNFLCQVFNVGKEDDCPMIFTGVNIYFHHGTLTMS